MTQCQKNAIDKINATKYLSVNRDREFVFPYVRDIILYFINESEAFAAAVNEEGKSLDKCVDSLKLVGKRVSDIDVYKECVAYFMPDAIVEFKMTIRVPQADKRAKILEFRIEDFL